MGDFRGVLNDSWVMGYGTVFMDDGKHGIWDMGTALDVS
jgi:hypothetical protein